MQSQRWAWTHRHAVPMFVASLVALTISVATAVAFLALGDAGGDEETSRADGQETSPGHDGSTPGDAATIDECVVGTWRTVGHTETIPAIDVTVELASGGATVEFNRDGTGATDYGDGMTLEGENTTVDFTGRVSFEYEAANGTFRYLSQDSAATLTLTTFGVPASQELTYSRKPARYECDGNTLRFSQEEQSYEGEYQRVSS